jgi:hypothetical protein
MAASRNYVVIVRSNEGFRDRAGRLELPSNLCRSSSDVWCRRTSCTSTLPTSKSAQMML